MSIKDFDYYDIPSDYDYSESIHDKLVGEVDPSRLMDYQDEHYNDEDDAFYDALDNGEDID